MTKVPHDERLVTLGVDTHADIHVAVALDHLGGMLGAIEIATTRAGCQQLLEWASQLGVVDRVGVEGTGSYGAGLFRWLRARGITVIEVDRPDRKLRRQRGKDDLTDAEGAARSVLSGQATGIPKSADGNVEMIRALREGPQIGDARQDRHHQPAPRLGRVRPRRAARDVRRADHHGQGPQGRTLRPGPTLGTVEAATKLALKKLARRYLALVEDTAELDTHIAPLVTETAPARIAQPGIGVQSTAQLLVTAGDNPERLRSEGSFAHLCGVAPLPASSGKRIDRHRLNKGGDRDANCALHMIAVNRAVPLRTHPRLRPETLTRRESRPRHPPPAQAHHRPRDLHHPHRRRPGHSSRPCRLTRIGASMCGWSEHRRRP
jgi:transposase